MSGLNNCLWLEMIEITKPQFFGVVQFFRAGEGVAKLVVINHFELGKHLVDGIDNR